MDSNTRGSSHSALCPGGNRTTTETSKQGSPTCTRAARPVSDNMWTVRIAPTIGGAFELRIHAKETVEGLKRSLSKKLKIPKEKISLLHRESILREGRLSEHGVCDGTCLKLLPNVESGLMSQKAENTVMQALENLSEGQVHEFLTGKSPLTLAMRLGDHMMFVQLQLSTNAPGYKRASSSSHSNYRCSKKTSSSSSSSSSPSSATPYTVHPATAATTAAATAAAPPPPPAVASSRSASRAPPRFARPNEAAVTPVVATPMSGSMSGPAVPSPLAATPAPTLEDMIRGARGSPTGSSSSDSSDSSDTEIPVLDSAALAQAKRNLSQKLKEISQLRGAAQPTAAKEPESASKEPDAIIESMQHLGHGVYSGTFSGALNPALQDRDGKPKRSISTIIHILNDLLGASPQYRAHLHASRKRRLDAAAAAAAACTEESGRLREENQATRGKMEQLQMRLEERRQRRRARRQARASPYSSSWATGLTNQCSSSQLQQQQQAQQPMEMDANLETTDVSDVGPYDLSQPEPESKLKNETVVA